MHTPDYYGSIGVMNAPHLHKRRRVVRRLMHLLARAMLRVLRISREDATAENAGSAQPARPARTLETRTTSIGAGERASAAQPV